jgi:hypothetical protein
VLAAVSIPWEPFGPSYVAQLAGGAALFAYLVHTWHRPSRRVDGYVIVTLIAYTLIRLSWSAAVFARLERPVESFTVPQLAAVTLGLIYPDRWRGGAVVIGLFTAQGLYALACAHYYGVQELVPSTEPFATVAFGSLALGILYLRYRSRELVERQRSARAEIEALERVRPTFLHAREVLQQQVDILAGELHESDRESRGTRLAIVDRTLDRLGDLGRMLSGVVATAAVAPPPQAAERHLLDHDAQLGATLLAMLGMAYAGLATFTFDRHLSPHDISWMPALFVFYTLMVGFLIATRRRPSSRRALWAVAILCAATIPIAVINQQIRLAEGRPFSPFLGHKLLMGIIGLTLATRFKLGVVLIVATAASAVATWFALDMGAHRDLMERAEPFATLLFMFVGILSLRVLERRQVAAIGLLRAEVEASAIRRQAQMLLALRDRLNSPLQALVLSASSAIPHVPAASVERVQAALDRLVDLSRALAELDVQQAREPSNVSFDANYELRSHLGASY